MSNEPAATPALPFIGLRMADTGDWWIQVLEIESEY